MTHSLAYAVTALKRRLRTVSAAESAVRSSARPGEGLGLQLGSGQAIFQRLGRPPAPQGPAGLCFPVASDGGCVRSVLLRDPVRFFVEFDRPGAQADK